VAIPRGKAAVDRLQALTGLAARQGLKVISTWERLPAPPATWYPMTGGPVSCPARFSALPEPLAARREVCEMEVVVPNGVPPGECSVYCYYGCLSYCWEDPYVRVQSEYLIYQLNWVQ